MQPILSSLLCSCGGTRDLFKSLAANEVTSPVFCQPSREMGHRDCGHSLLHCTLKAVGVLRAGGPGCLGRLTLWGGGAARLLEISQGFSGEVLQDVIGAHLLFLVGWEMFHFGMILI